MGSSRSFFITAHRKIIKAKSSRVKMCFSCSKSAVRISFLGMKVSAFTFLRNGHKLGYPFMESIRSILPIVDEFVIALGPCEDDTEKSLRAIGEAKIKIINTQWNERMRSDYSIKGFVYGQQKSIALFNCTGDWAFYLEGDEVVHENELRKIGGW